MSELSKYDALLTGIANKLRPTTFKELNDMMSVVALFFTNPSEQDIDFANIMTSIYLLDMTKVPFDSNIFKDHKKELNAMLKAIHKFKDAFYDKGDEDQLAGYAGNLNKQGKKFDA